MEEALKKLTEALVDIMLTSPKFKEFVRAEVNDVPPPDRIDELLRTVKNVVDDMNDVTERMDRLDSSDIDDFSSAVRDVVRDMNFTVEVRN